MTDVVQTPAAAGWRLMTSADVPFVYELITAVDPRWWRFSRHGLEPSGVLRTALGIGAGAIVHGDDGQAVACAALADTGASATGSFEYFALPDDHAHDLARRFAPDLIAAAFDGAAIRRLYHERFEGDPELLGALRDLFEIEVTYPDFALVEGRFEARTVSVLTAERFRAWQTANGR